MKAGSLSFRGQKRLSVLLRCCKGGCPLQPSSCFLWLSGNHWDSLTHNEPFDLCLHLHKTLFYVYISVQIPAQQCTAIILRGFSITISMVILLPQFKLLEVRARAHVEADTMKSTTSVLIRVLGHLAQILYRVNSLEIYRFLRWGGNLDPRRQV